MSNASAYRKLHYKATVVQHANKLLDQTNFPKKPLRKSHLSSVYFTKLFGLTSPLTATKNADVFELYLSKVSKRTTIDPVISIFGK